MPFYASLNDVLSLCMIMAVFALLVGRSQSFASPHFVLSMSSARASNSGAKLTWERLVDVGASSSSIPGNSARKLA
jgi:hypothetical protein